MNENFWYSFEKRAGLGLNRLSKGDAAEILSQSVREGGSGLLASPLAWASNKVLGKKRTVKALRAMHEPLLHADTELGHHLSKIPLVGRLFKQDELLRAGKDTLKKYQRPSALAPLSKATEIAKPIVFGGAVSKAIQKAKENKENQSKNHG